MKAYGKYALVVITLFFVLFSLISLAGQAEYTLTELASLLIILSILYVFTLSITKKNTRGFKHKTRSPPLS